MEFCLQDVYKNNVPPDPPWYGTSWQVFLELTFSDVVTSGGQRLRPDGKKCFAPLPRTVYLVDNPLIATPLFDQKSTLKPFTTVQIQPKGVCLYPAKPFKFDKTGMFIQFETVQRLEPTVPCHR